MRLSQQDRSAFSHLANDGSVGGTDSPFVNRRTVLCGQAPCLDDVFHSERNLGQLTITGWPLGQHLDPGVNGGFHFLNAIQA